VTVVDGLTNTISAVVPVRSYPRALLHNPVGNRVYCSNSGDGTVPATITVIDGDGDSVLRTIEIGAGSVSGGHALCLDPTDNRVYVGSYHDNTVVVVDAVADTIIARVPSVGRPLVLCHSPAYNYVYVGTRSSSVSVIDCELNVLIAELRTGDNPFSLLYNSVGAKVYAVGPVSFMSVIAGERPGEAGGWVSDLRLNSSDNRVYCADAEGEAVNVVDADVDSIVATVPVGVEPWALSYDALNNYVYCACRASNEVYVIDAHRDTVVTAIEVGAEPRALAWNPTELRTYVLNYGSSSVSVIRDSLHVGIAEDGVSAKRLVTPTVVRGVLELGVDSRQYAGYRANLLDVAGRKVMDLQAGANDIRHLAPGVYFVVTPSPFSSPPEGERVGVRRSHASVVKIVVTR